MANQKVVSWIIISLFLGLSLAEIVDIEDGQINGTEMSSRLGVIFKAFLRIPFAQAPTGDLRFRAPQPALPWTGVLDGTAYGPMCVQTNARPDYGLVEDCLQLNVFTKSLTELKPVIVFFHGGAFEVGTATDQGGPHNLMDRDVVVVTANYRLGALGFLATGTKDAPGNAALKDQVLALKWIQKNIEKFGGDRNKVTITGLSAGAYSVTAHMVSPLASDLFHGVIAMSGSIAGQMTFRTENLDLAKKLGAALNCTTNDTEALISCLKTKTALEIVNINLKNHPECEIASWFPVMEPDFGQERYLTADPVDLFRAGNFSKVPVMIGRTTDEFANTVPILLAHPTGLKELNDNFDKMAPQCFVYEQNSKKSEEISSALRNAYFPFDTIDVRSFSGLNNLYGDSYIGYSIHRFVHFASNLTDVFYYKFSYVGRFSIFNYPHNKPYGVHHVDDLQYPFFVDFLTPLIQPTDPEHFMVERMTRIWEHFALTGNPNYDPELFTWPKHNSTHEFYMDIGTHMVEKNGLYLERYTVWDKVLASSGANIQFHNIFFIFFIALLY